jgi:DNA-binding NarL/FixJ family response regulator
MPVVKSIEATRALRNAFPDLSILIQTVFEDDDNLFKSLQAGASGYILEKTSPDKILEAMKDARSGGAPITPAMVFKVLRFFQSSNTVIAVDYGIIERENQILKLLVEGYSYKMIAGEQCISYHTVNSHVRNIYDKLHVHSIGEAVSKALKENLLK